MKTVFIFFITFFSITAGAQVPVFNWCKQLGGTGFTTASSVVVDGAGDIYTIGNFQGTVDFDPGAGIFNLTALNTSFNGLDIFISKFDAAGNFMWAKHIGGQTFNSGYKIVLDANNNIYISGAFIGVVDFDPGPAVFNLTSTTNPDFFICKLDAAGNFIWVKQTGGLVTLSGVNLAVEANGNVYASGNFRGTPDFDPGPGIFNMTSNAFRDIFITKLDAAGNFVWAKQVEFIDPNNVWCMVTDATGNVLITGDFIGQADFDPGPGVFNLNSNAGSRDCFILKLDGNGNFVWAKSIGGVTIDQCQAITTDVSGNVLTTGNFSSTVDFDPGASAYNLIALPGERRIFVCKLDAAGNFIWAKGFDGTALAGGLSIDTDAGGNVYSTGRFNGLTDFDPGAGVYNMNTFGFEDIYLSKLDAAGNFLWARQIGGTENDVSYSSVIDPSGNIYTVGNFETTADFNPGLAVFNLTPIGTTDAFIHKMHECINSSTYSFSTAGCNSFTLNGQTFTASGVYVQLLLSITGCDSIITLDLTINHGTNDTSTITACDSYTWQGQTFTTSGFYRDTLITTGGCDSILNLGLTIKYKVTTLINISICQGQNYAGHTSTGTYTDTYTAANGCDSIRTVNLTVNPRFFSTINYTMCQGDNYWGHTATGVYIDTFIAANGCDSIRTLQLVVYPVAFTVINVAICQGQSYFAGGASQSTAGIYKDTLLTSLGCDSIVTTNLVVNASPKPNLGTDRNLCFNNIPLSITPGIFSSYLWQDNSTQPGFIIINKGKYWVTVTDANNCMATDTITIPAIDSVPANFLPADQLICYGIRFNITVAGYKNYLWSTGDITSAVSINTAGTYFLLVTNNNNCTGKDTIVLQRNYNCIPVNIPNAFTPNKDGVNDIFKPIITKDVSDYSFSIFNRYGQKIFTSNSYETGWDGTFKAVPQPGSVYIYRLSFKNIDGELSEHKGMVTLIR